MGESFHVPWGQLLLVGLPGPRIDAVARQLIQELQVGGIVLFRRNLESPRQLALLTNELQRLSLAATGAPLFLAIDQEGGPVQRLRAPFTTMAAAREWGQRDEPQALEAQATRIAQELRLVGINMNLAPVLDVARGPECPLWERSYGPEPEKVARLGLAALRGFQTGGVIPVAKHFPGLGATRLDSHQERPTAQGDSREREKDLFPFRQAIAAGAPAIMSAHVVVPAWDHRPATLSRQLLTGHLRQRLGFQGLILTDDLEMGAIARHQPVADAAVQALAAGADLLLICENPDAIVQAHASLARSTGLSSCLAEALHRIRRVKQAVPPVPVDLDAVQAYFHSREKRID